LGLSVGNLMSLDGATAMPEQLLLPFGRKDQSLLDVTVDSLRDRFGRSALMRASLLGRNVGFETPKLPD
jgi:DNA polymerase IV